MKDGEYFGSFGELVKELSLELNFTISQILWEDNPGAWDSETSKWTGVIGRIQREEADLGVHGFSINKERHKVVSFTSPISITPIQMHVKKKDSSRLVWDANFKVGKFKNNLQHIFIFFSIDPNLTDGLLIDRH